MSDAGTLRAWVLREIVTGETGVTFSELIARAAREQLYGSAYDAYRPIDRTLQALRRQGKIRHERRGRLIFWMPVGAQEAPDHE